MTEINLLQFKAPIDILTIQLRVAEKRRLNKTDDEVCAEMAEEDIAACVHFGLAVIDSPTFIKRVSRRDL